MGEHVTIAVPAEPAATVPHHAVLVGWSHTPCGTGINLKVQSAESQAALRAGTVEAHHFLMTRNQALILTRYLLEITGQTLDMPARPHGWRAMWHKLRRH